MKALILRLALVLIALVLPESAGAYTFETVFDNTMGTKPTGNLVKGSDGSFYGTTRTGGRGYGGVFKMAPDGVLTMLVSFTYYDAFPAGGLVAGSDGNFYGMTQSNYGTVFRVSPTGTFKSIARFSEANGTQPNGTLVEGSDGSFYGTTQFNGADGYGTVFKITPAGTLTLLHSFTRTDGEAPSAGLTIGNDGNFYGTTPLGGVGNFGTVFKITPTGTLTTLVHFNGANGSQPRSALTRGSDGNFYGTTQSGGIDGRGTVFKVTPDGMLTTLASFLFINGKGPLQAPLLEGSDGNFYGTTLYGSYSNVEGTVFKVTPAGRLTTLTSFSGNGRQPVSGLIDGGDGSFYGTTFLGGASDLGTVYKVTPEGALTTLATFTGTSATIFSAGLVAARDGNLYGTTWDGGLNSSGTVFRMTLEGILTQLTSFDGSNSSQPYGLLEGSDGNLYGITSAWNIPEHYGTVFKVTPSGTLSTLFAADSNFLLGLGKGRNGNLYGTLYDGHLFEISPTGMIVQQVSINRTIGYAPSAPVEASDGNLYGTTLGSGTSNFGAVFKMTPNGTLRRLASFNSNHGKFPRAKLLAGSDGALYGTTSEGGRANRGTVFKVSVDGTLTTLAHFDRAHGRNPTTELVEGSDGNFYGTTRNGGIGDLGTVYRVTPTGTLTTLHDFHGSGTKHPNSSPVFGNDGHLYGTSEPTTVWRIKDPTTLPALIGPASNEAIANTINVSFILPRAALSGTVTLTFTGVRETQTFVLAASQETAGAHSFSVDVTNPTASPEVASGLPLEYDGAFTVTLAYQYDAGKPDVMGVASGVKIYLRSPVLASKGAPVPGSGEAGSGIPSGAVWSTFGVPSVNDAGQIAFLGSWKAGATKGEGIFRQGPGVTPPTLVAAKGGASGIDNAVFNKFLDPLLAPDGSVAWTATLSGPGRKSNSTAIFLDADGPGPESAHMVARTGASEGTAWKKFTSVALGDGALAFTGTLGGVPSGRSGLWLYNRTTATVHLAAHEGQTVEGSTIRSLVALAERPRVAGNGRGVVPGPDGDQVAFQLALADKRTAIAVTTQTGVTSIDYMKGDAAPIYLGIPARLLKPSLPTQSPETGSVAFLSTETIGNGEAARETEAIFAEDDTTHQLTRITARGASAGTGGGYFASIHEPVSGKNRRVAFTASMYKGPRWSAIRAFSDTGIWLYDPQNGLANIAWEGSQPAEIDEPAGWRKFTSLAITADGRPLFVATIDNRGGPQTRGLWATDSTGTLRLLLLEGDRIGTSTVRSFTVLSSVLGSPAQTRSFNNTGTVVMRAIDAKGAEHLLQIVVP